MSFLSIMLSLIAVILTLIKLSTTLREKMIKDKYNSFDEWYEDYLLFKDNPNDNHLLTAIEFRTKNSKKDIQKEIQVYIQGEALEYNPMRVLQGLQQELGPGYVILIKDEQDPWFEA